MLSKSYLQPMIKMLFTTAIPPLLYLVIFVCLSTQRVAAKKNMMIRCVEREKQALLDFKQGLVDEFEVLSSWVSDDDECCNWWGVHCNNNTGHVTVLDLHPTRLDDYGFPIHQQLRSRRKVSPSLLELKHLSYLDLSYIDFQGSSIPEFIGSFPSLQVLKLMYVNFSGTIPPHFGNLTNLQILNITASDLKIKNLEWISHLSSLRSIYLDDIEIDLTDESPEASVTLPPLLEVLQMPRCQLIGTLPFTLNSSSPLLSVVDFSENTLTSSSWVFHFLRNASKQLTSIDLSRNNFTGPIPDTFGDMIFLENLNLRLNSFMDGIPKSFENLTHLQTLDLTENKLIGELPANISAIFPSLRELYASENQLNGSIFELPSCLEHLDLSGNKIKGLLQDLKCSEQECDLMYLDLSKNQIMGQFPDLSQFSSLREIHLFGNQITGYFPDLSHAPSLRVIDLSQNKLQGGLSETIGKLSKLEKLFASSNSMEGVVTEAHFSNLTKLQSLDLSFNVALSFNLSSNWVPPFLLYDIILANFKVGPQFPKWLQTQSKIVQLDISSGGILDVIPDWFWNSSQNYNSLNLSYNQIEGRLPDDLPMGDSYLQVIDLSSNNFWGLISTFFGGVSVFHLSNNKFVGSISFLCESIEPLVPILSIDLSNNQLTGEIPDCWNYARGFPSLSILNLANNNFFGRVPMSLGSLSRLQSLHLRNNNLTGELPSSLQNCISLRVMDLGGNKFTGRIPSWIGGYLTNLVIVSLRHNKFYGKISSSICHLNSIQILDLSENKLSGEIPQCFNNFTYLMKNSSSIGSTIRSLDATSFQEIVYYIDNILIQWKNKEREYRKQLGLLKSIDLSSNQLTGDISAEFSVLKGLISLNLSNNRLIGKIFPTIYQMENLEVLDLSKNQLYGKIPIGLAHLNFLAVLDLSNNFLSGKIPTGIQLQSFNVSSYAGNIGLCGDPLPKCPADVPPQSKINDYQEGDGFMNRGFYISMVFGFSLSFWGIVVTLVLKNSWRIAYYEFLNDVKDWLYVKVKIYLGKLQQKLRRTR